MKKLFYLCIAFVGMSASAQVGIGVPTADINASAQLEVSSTSKGFLAPRMTQAQKNNISSPAAGLLVYQTDAPSGFYYFDGSVWQSGLGPQGPQGATGPQGAQGVAGATGPMGPQGIQGIAGATGAQGLQGVAGNDGLDGVPGPQGDMGPQGPQGPQGVPGVAGAIGAQGPAGVNGIDGMNGVDGATGPMGPQGDMGPQGPQGEMGPAGIDGVAGVPGPQGEMGPAGIDGVAGVPGPQGEMGPQGPSGTPADLSAYATIVALNTKAPIASPVFTGSITTPGVIFDAGNWQMGPYGSNFTLYKGGCCNFITVDGAGRMGIGGNYSPSYPLDVQGEGRFTSALRATSFIKTGGTSSQYLMADGSSSEIDLSGYATTTALNNEVTRAETAEATLAPKASPSFTGVVTVGGASSTASAVVEVSSTTQGFLPPRMTAAQRDAISSPVAGLVLWCTNCGTNGELNVYNGTSWKNMIGGTVAAVPHYVGESFGGGKVAYILQPGDPGYEPNVEHGIIAASNTFTQNVLWVAWGPLHSPAVGSTGTAIGTGLQNSKNVNLAYSGTQTGFGGIPTSLAMLYNGGEFSDWYLPSKDELLKCMLNQNAIGLLNANNSAYWTSSEYNQYNAWYCYYNFNTGEISSGYELKNGGFLVLPIRSF